MDRASLHQIGAVVTRRDHPAGRLLRMLKPAICALILFSAASVAAQSAATLSGSVIDPEAKAVINAVVLVRNQASSDIRTTMTDTAGRFVVRDLMPGIYSVEVAVPGFDVVQR